MQGLLSEVLFAPLEPASVRAQSLGAGHAIPPGSDAWFSKTVTREIAQRHPNASSALAALAPVLGGHSLAPLSPRASTEVGGASNASVATSIAPRERRSSALVLWIVGVVGLLLVAGLLLTGLGGAVAGFYFANEPGPAPTCASTAAAAHEWGAGPPETKSFTFNL